MQKSVHQSHRLLLYHNYLSSGRLAPAAAPTASTTVDLRFHGNHLALARQILDNVWLAVAFALVKMLLPSACTCARQCPSREEGSE